MSELREGGCQCGNVRYRLNDAPLALALCHCKECQRQSGSAFGMSLMVRQGDFEILAGELREFERSSDSGRPIRCFFCASCGNRIYHQPTYAEEVLNVKAGTLDDTSFLSPDMQVWTSSKQPWLGLSPSPEAYERQPG